MAAYTISEVSEVVDTALMEKNRRMAQAAIAQSSPSGFRARGRPRGTTRFATGIS
jgi:hypothetical protein